MSSPTSHLVLWRSPFRTLLYFALECLYWFTQYYKVILKLLILIATTTFLLLRFTHAEKQLYWCAKWVVLGILSSIGLGTGMHTFVLYLMPHIAAVTLAAYDCGSLDFPEPPYPDDIICPTSQTGATSAVTVFAIFNKVKLECFMWGAGTAIGELPPYFLAKFRQSSLTHSNSLSANLSSLGDSLDGENSTHGNPLIAELPIENNHDDTWERYISNLIKKVGFVGILLCASIPNPLFDLAGISCGTAQVPFLTFFGATLLGKAVNKMLLQTFFVIITLSGETVENVIKFSNKIPTVGPYIQEFLHDFFVKQKANLHRGTQNVVKEASLLSWFFDKIVISIVVFFVISLINSMAQNYSARMHQTQADHPTKKKQK